MVHVLLLEAEAARLRQQGAGVGMVLLTGWQKHLALVSVAGKGLSGRQSLPSSFSSSIISGSLLLLRFS